MGKRQCLFCHNPANSDEHLWPHWILKRLKIDRPMRHAIGGQPARIIPRAEIKIKCVCKLCNEGWMHDLENLNIPVIGCLMEDVGMPLDSQQQIAVSRWAAKTAMVQDAIYGKRALFYTASERFALRLDSIPANTLVWLGRSSLRTLFVDGYDVGFDFRNATTEIPEPANGCVSTFVVGHLAVQVLTIHIPEKYSAHPWEVPCIVAGPWDQLLIPIWPTNKAANWPPSLYFKGPRGITNLSSRLRGGVRRTHL